MRGRKRGGGGGYVQRPPTVVVVVVVRSGEVGREGEIITRGVGRRKGEWVERGGGVTPYRCRDDGGR